MIQIEEIRIREFRGIRDLGLKLCGKSFVVWGPNGSGKSGVVDAIEFVLTGSVSRLEGSGSGGLTLVRHAPHVHKRDDPASAQVSVTIRDTASGKTAVLTRNAKNAQQYMLDPDLPDVRAAVEKVQQHPELTLSRREIIKYIVVEASKRSKEVQALLKLDRIGEIRSVLKTVQTKTSGAENGAQGQANTAESALLRHLDLTSLLATEVASAVNRYRRVLGLEPINGVDQDADLSHGVDVDSSQSAFNKIAAIRDVTVLTERLAAPTAFLAAVTDLNEALAVVEADPGLLEALRHRDVVSAGLALVVDSHCPLCDLEWPDVEALRAHLRDKLARSDEAAKLQGRIQEAAQAVTAESQSLRGFVTAARDVVASDGDDGLVTQLQTWSDELVAFETQLGSVEGAASQVPRLTGEPLRLPAGVLGGLTTLLSALKGKPDQTATANARSFLIVAQERWTALRLARAELNKKADARSAARVIYDTFCKVSDEMLIGLYHDVEEEFSSHYREINSDDESTFKGYLEPSAGKLDLRVDFYGLGMFPPAAYHSEGHQDGMGVCLYLALVNRLLGADFRFAVLDDVVMSIDRNHRRQFCNLLKTRFPDVQFVITTHDEVWARQMLSSGLIAKTAQARFHGWTVDCGPAYEEASDVWDKIDADLVNDDVPSAAARLRRYLESQMTEVAENLHGRVAYKADANYDLGVLLAAVKGKYGKLLGLAMKSANRWGDDGARAHIADLKEARAAAVLTQEDENWAINPAVHFNDWANFTKPDFLPVVVAWKHFLALFTCDNTVCASWIYVVPKIGTEEVLRCHCGKLNLNLRAS